MSLSSSVSSSTTHIAKFSSPLTMLVTTTHHVGAVLTTKYYLVNTNTVLNLQLVLHHVPYMSLDGATRFGMAQMALSQGDSR